MPASIAVATKRSVAGSTPLFHATVAYKQWARQQMAERGWSFARTIAEMKRHEHTLTLSTAGLSYFFTDKNGDTVPSNNAFIPALNAALEIAPPNICDPTSPHSQLRDKFDATWAKLTPRERAGIAAIFGITTPKSE